MMNETANVIVINIHGGFPSCMIKKAFTQLPAFSELYSKSDLYTRVYPTNSSAGPSLHDIIMDAPLGSMVDSVWHDWCNVRHATRTLFHIFQQNGYSTNLFGAFGLERKLDPHSNMYNFPGECKKSLELYGVDEFETQDAAFTCQMAFAHDRDVISRACSFFEQSDNQNFTMINLLGCQDIHKCNFSQVQENNVAVPIVSMENIDSWSKSGSIADVLYQDPDKRHYAESVINDDPRNDITQASKIIALKRSVMLYDWLRGSSSDDKHSNDILTMVSELHRFAWKCLIEMDKSISKLLAVLKKTNLLNRTNIYITSDHPISLYEHGEICEAPWDACLRSFLLVRIPGQVDSKEYTQPYSLAHLSTRIMNDCNLYADWHITIKDSSNTVTTIGLCPSWLSRAFINPKIDVFSFKTFYMRFIITRYGRLYSIIIWFSINDLLMASNVEYEHLSHSELSVVCSRISEWKNPITERDLISLGSIQVYDLTTDPSEMINIANIEWLQSKAALSLKSDIDVAVNECGYDNLKIIFPSYIHQMTPDKVTFCSVQLHNRLKDRINHEKEISKCNSETQTENITLPFLLNSEFGNFSKLIIPKLQKHHSSPLTIFIPENFTNTEKMQEWVPNSIIGVYNRDTLTLLAKNNIEIIDINGYKIKLRMINSNIILNESILCSNANFLIHSTSQIVFYKVKKNEEKENKQEENKKNKIKSEKKTEYTSDITNIDIISLTSESTNSTKKSKSRNDILVGRKLTHTDDKKNQNFDEKKGKAKSNELRLIQKEAHR